MKRKRKRKFSPDVVDIEKERSRRDDEELIHLQKVRQERAKSAERKKQTKRIIRIAAYVIIIGLALYGIIKPVVTIVQLENEKRALENRNEELELQLKELKEDVENAGSPEYVEKVVRERLNMIYPDEILYITDEKRTDKKKTEDDDK